MDLRGKRRLVRMTYLRVIERLENLLRLAAEIIERQTEILTQNGIPTGEALQTLQERFKENMDKWC